MKIRFRDGYLKSTDPKNRFFKVVVLKKTIPENLLIGTVLKPSLKITYFYNRWHSNDFY